jgi:hypothetical protein
MGEFAGNRKAILRPGGQWWFGTFYEKISGEGPVAWAGVRILLPRELRSYLVRATESQKEESSKKKTTLTTGHA